MVKNMIISKEQLKKIHKLQLSAMVYFDKICKYYYIPYTLAYGTLLGAIRHKGFIPWDDDVDILLTRKNFEKLRSLPQKIWGPNYFYQSYFTDKNYKYSYDKLRINNTFFGEEALMGSGISNNGLFLDIFPADKITNDFKTKIQMYSYLINHIIFMFKYININHRHGKEKKIAELIRYLFNDISINNLLLTNEKIVMKYDNINSNYYCAFNSYSVKNKIYPKKFFTSLKYTYFEGKKFLISNYYDQMLKQSYGNYMKLPNKSKRINKHKIVGLII